MLMRMDRGGVPPEGIGGIPQLTAPGEDPSRKWRRAAVFAIVVAMLAVPAAAIMMRSRPVALTAMGASAPVGPLPAPGTPSPTALDERFLALVRRALEAAQERVAQRPGWAGIRETPRHEPVAAGAPEHWPAPDAPRADEIPQEQSA